MSTSENTTYIMSCTSFHCNLGLIGQFAYIVYLAMYSNTDLLDFDPLIQESQVLFQGSVPLVLSQILHKPFLALHDRQPVILL